MSKKSSTKPTNKKSERLLLATAITSLTTKQEAFIKAVETMKQLEADTLTNLDLEINTKKLELENLEKDFKRKQKDGQIETDQFLNEYSYEAACKILKEHNEEPINSEKLKTLHNDLDKYKTGHEEELEKLKNKEREKAQKSLKAALTNNELKHKAEVAEMAASVNQQKKEIQSLENTIKNLQNELSQQRQLTKDVAEASRPAPITVQGSK